MVELRIIVRNILGTGRVEVLAEDHSTVGDVVSEAAPKLKINPERVVVMYRGKQVPLEATLKEAGLTDGSKILVTPGAIVAGSTAVSDSLLMEEYNAIMSEYPGTFIPVEDELTHYFGTIKGGGTYEEGIFPIELEMTSTYPYDPPVVKLHARIWHPNIKSHDPPLTTFWRNGKPIVWDICVNVITTDWRPTSRLISVIDWLFVLFTQPNPDDPLNRVAARQMKEDFATFETKAREWVRLYANVDNYFDARSSVLEE